jgi:hypothetical protein
MGRKKSITVATDWVRRWVGLMIAGEISILSAAIIKKAACLAWQAAKE